MRSSRFYRISRIFRSGITTQGQHVLQGGLFPDHPQRDRQGVGVAAHVSHGSHQRHDYPVQNAPEAVLLERSGRSRVTVSQAVRTCGVRRSRYVGLEKTQLHHLLSAAALNFLRVGEWLSGIDKPKARCAPFARLMAQQAAA